MDIKNSRAMRDDMRALTVNERQQQELAPIIKRGAMLAQRGRGDFSGSDMNQSSGGGIASPLTESPGTRTFYNQAVVVPTNGYYAYSVRAVKKLTMTDADNNSVEINLAEPVYVGT